jgi:hypothetical protein
MGNPMPELTFPMHAVAGFNSNEVTMNLGSELVKDSASGAEIWRTAGRTRDIPLGVLFLAARNGPRCDGFSANSFRANIPPFNCRGDGLNTCHLNLIIYLVSAYYLYHRM